MTNMERCASLDGSDVMRWGTVAERQIWQIHSTFASKDEALSVARTLLEKRLIACANISEGVTSLYFWKGKIEEAQEVVLTAKTSHARLTEAIAEIKRLHAYEIPCITASAITEGYAPFFDWVESET